MVMMVSAETGGTRLSAAALVGTAPPEMDADVVDLVEAPIALDLPTGATANADGTVTLTLDYPVLLKTRAPGADTPVSERIDTLMFHRLLGASMRKILAAKGATTATLALALSTRSSHARMAVLYERMDASDAVAANACVAQLCGFDGEDGLPAAAEELDGVVKLPLMFAAETADGGLHRELNFHRMTSKDLVAIAQAKDTLPMALAVATRMTPKEAGALFDAMDAADIMAAQRVIGFLSGSGRRTGR